MVRFWTNFSGMFLGWPFSKSFREILIGQEIWLWWMGATCTIWKWRNSWKVFFSETPWSDFKIIWQGCSLGDPCSCEWELLALYGHDEILENSLSLKPLVRFKRKIPKCSLGDPFENLFVNFDPSRNMALVDGGYLLLYRNEEFLKILSFETDGQISKWTLQVTFWKLLSKIINLVSIPQKKNRLWLSQKFRWAIQGHLGPLVL